MQDWDVAYAIGAVRLVQPVMFIFAIPLPPVSFADKVSGTVAVGVVVAPPAIVNVPVGAMESILIGLNVLTASQFPVISFEKYWIVYVPLVDNTGGFAAEYS